MALAQITSFDDTAYESDRLIRAVHAALVAALRVPDDDPTVWHRSVDTAVVAARHGRHAVLVEIMFEGRAAETIASLHRHVADELAAIGVEPSKVLCVIAEWPPRNWSIAGVPQDRADVGFDIKI